MIYTATNETAGDPPLKVHYTYSVRIKKSDLLWTHRFDHFAKQQQSSDRVHHMQFLVSVGIALLLFWVVKCCMNRVINKDLNQVHRNNDKLNKVRDARKEQAQKMLDTDSMTGNSNQEESETMKDLQKMFKGVEKVTWTKLSHDVFRAPPATILLCSLVGCGSQCAAISVTVIILFSVGNILDAQQRDQLIGFRFEFCDYVYLTFFWVSAFYGILSGYVSARLYKFFNGTAWLISFYINAALIPLSVSVILLIIDCLNWYEKLTVEKAFRIFGDDLKGADFSDPRTAGKFYSSISLPQSDVTFMYAFWLVINIPSVAFGTYRGYKADRIAVPVRTSRIERQIPKTSEIPCHAQTWFTLTAGSLLTSLCVISELFYLMASIWRHSYYFMFGYLGVSLVIMMFVVTQVSKVQTYWTLNSGNYQWQWKSFLIGFMVGLQLFLLLSWFNFFKEEHHSYLVWLTYSMEAMLGCLFVGLMAGSIAFAGSWAFVQDIYTEAQRNERSK